MLFTVSVGARTKESSDHHPFEAEQGHCWRSLICHYVMLRCVVKLYGFYISIVRPMQNTDARDGPGLKLLTWTLIFCSWQQFVRSKRQRAMQTRGSNQIKWASQKVAHTFLVLFALGCILISCLWCLHRELTITIFTSFQQTKGHLFIGPKKHGASKLLWLFNIQSKTF